MWVCFFSYALSFFAYSDTGACGFKFGFSSGVLWANFVYGWFFLAYFQVNLVSLLSTRRSGSYTYGGAA